MSIYLEQNRNLSESQHSPTSSNMDPPPLPPRHESLPPLNPNPFALMRANIDQANTLRKEMAGLVESIETRLITIHPLFKDPNFKFLPKSDVSLGSGSSVSPTTGGFRPQQAYDPVKGAEEDGDGYDPRKPATGQTLLTEESIEAYDPKKPGTGQATPAPSTISSEIMPNYQGFSIFGIPLSNQRDTPNNTYWDSEKFVDSLPTGAKRKHVQSYPMISNPPAKKRRTGAKQEPEEETAKYWPKGWPKGWPRSFDSGTMSGYIVSGEDSPEQPKAPPPTAIGLGISGVSLYSVPLNGPIARQLKEGLNNDLFGEEEASLELPPIYASWEEMQESESDDCENDNWEIEPRERTSSGPEANFEFDHEEFRQVTDDTLLSEEDVKNAKYRELEEWEQGEYHEPLSPMEGYNGPVCYSTRRACFKCGEDSIDGHLERACPNLALPEPERQRVIQEWKAKFQKSSKDIVAAWVKHQNYLRELIKSNKFDEGEFVEILWSLGNSRSPFYERRRICFNCGECSGHGHLGRDCKEPALPENERQRLREVWEENVQEQNENFRNLDAGQGEHGSPSEPMTPPEEGEYLALMTPLEDCEGPDTYETRLMCFKCGVDGVNGHLEKNCTKEALPEHEQKRVREEYFYNL
ncbi:hypothetical protein BDZ45DRAFT_737135 [Acephala macrosclerotiorum]|nr:hypothetical protein BDZ45DRAFT_737135 [Acephala macrosclerotiorum]